jgi:prevent-host-death family protein
MQFIPYRTLRNEPGKLQKQLRENKELIITQNGEPFALMISVKPDEIEKIVALVVQLRAQLALDEIRADAAARGLDKMTMEEVDAMIRAYRAERRARRDSEKTED